MSEMESAYALPAHSLAAWANFWRMPAPLEPRSFVPMHLLYADFFLPNLKGAATVMIIPPTFLLEDI